MEVVQHALREQGLELDPAFDGLTEIWRRQRETFVEAASPNAAVGGEFAVPPALLDAALIPLLLDEGTRHGNRPVLPCFWRGVAIRDSAVPEIARIRISPCADGSAAVVVTSRCGEPVLTVDSVELRPVELDAFTSGLRGSVFEIAWATAAPTP